MFKRRGNGVFLHRERETRVQRRMKAGQGGWSQGGTAMKIIAVSGDCYRRAVLRDGGVVIWQRWVVLVGICPRPLPRYSDMILCNAVHTCPGPVDNRAEHRQISTDIGFLPWLCGTVLAGATVRPRAQASRSCTVRKDSTTLYKVRYCAIYRRTAFLALRLDIGAGGSFRSRNIPKF